MRRTRGWPRCPASSPPYTHRWGPSSIIFAVARPRDPRAHQPSLETGARPTFNRERPSRTYSPGRPVKEFAGPPSLGHLLNGRPPSTWRVHISHHARGVSVRRGGLAVCSRAPMSARRVRISPPQHLSPFGENCAPARRRTTSVGRRAAGRLFIDDDARRHRTGGRALLTLSFVEYDALGFLNDLDKPWARQPLCRRNGSSFSSMPSRCLLGVLRCTCSGRPSLSLAGPDGHNCLSWRTGGGRIFFWLPAATRVGYRFCANFFANPVGVDLHMRCRQPPDFNARIASLLKPHSGRW